MDGQKIGGGNQPRRRHDIGEGGKSSETQEGSVKKIEPDRSYLPAETVSGQSPVSQKSVHERSVSRGPGLGSWVALAGGIAGGVAGLFMGAIPLAVGGIAVAAFTGGRMHTASQASKTEDARASVELPDVAKQEEQDKSQGARDDKNKELGEALAKQQLAVRDERQKGKQQTANLKQQIAQKDHQIAQQNQEIAALQQRNSSQIESSTKNKEKMSQRLQTKSSKNERLEEEKKVLKEKLASAVSEGGKGKLRNQELLRQNEEYRRIGAEQKQELLQQSKQLDQLQNSKDIAEKALADYQNKLDGMAEAQSSSVSPAGLNLEEYATELIVPSSAEELIRWQQGTILQLRSQVGMFMEESRGQVEASQSGNQEPIEWELLSEDSGVDQPQAFLTVEESAEYRELDSQLHDALEDLEHMKQQLKTEKQSAQQELQKQQQGFDTEMETSRKRSERLEKELSSASQKLEQAQQQLEQQGVSYEDRVGSSTTRNEQLKQELKATQEQLESTRRELDSLIEENRASALDTKKAESSKQETVRQAMRMNTMLEALGKTAGIDVSFKDGDSEEARLARIEEGLTQSLVDAENGRILQQRAEIASKNAGKRPVMDSEQYLRHLDSYVDFWREVMTMMGVTQDVDKMDPELMIVNMEEWVKNKNLGAEKWEKVCQHMLKNRNDLSSEKLFELLMQTHLPR